MDVARGRGYGQMVGYSTITVTEAEPTLTPSVPVTVMVCWPTARVDAQITTVWPVPTRVPSTNHCTFASGRAVGELLRSKLDALRYTSSGQITLLWKK